MLTTAVVELVQQFYHATENGNEAKSAKSGDMVSGSRRYSGFPPKPNYSRIFLIRHLNGIRKK